MTALATTDDLASYLQTTFTGGQVASAQLALDMASSAIRTATRQTISRVTSDTVTLKPPAGYELRLPEMPADQPTVVQVGGATVTDWSFDGYATLYRNTGWFTFDQVTGAPQRVAITYTHGYATVPGEILRVCLQAAARAFRNPEGLRSETTGSESYTYATETVQAVDLTADEVRAVRSALRLPSAASSSLA